MAQTKTPISLESLHLPVANFSLIAVQKLGNPHIHLIHSWGRKGELLDEMSERGLLPNHVIFTTLIKGLCEDERVDLAMDIYQCMPRNHIWSDLITCNTLLDELLKSGNLMGPWKLISQMNKKGVRPDKITYTTLIDGYCKAGDLDSAYEVQKEMTENRIMLDNVATQQEPQIHSGGSFLLTQVLKKMSPMVNYLMKCLREVYSPTM
ncbi:unnamed protein product [Cuscuta epithymum]|uniref:Pentatricopeptide repeat-containing protein n=1 Tax=Cuscuta epithymum TaxID=186058 RepID=A0AAV0F6F1_9ASTE|nr:unnamed protein product [Cuscuta epithymum]